MYIKEETTVELLRLNGYIVDGSLTTFIKEYLNVKYPFVIPEKTNEGQNMFGNSGFGLYMYMCNCLLNVENLEFDYTYFDIHEGVAGSTSYETFYVPQPSGLSLMVKNNIMLKFHFKKTPGFMVDYIVHPITCDTKTLYLKGLYMFFRGGVDNSYIDHVLPFGESIKELFKNARNVPFEEIINKLILSQLPTFDEYFNGIEGFIKSKLFQYYPYYYTDTILDKKVEGEFKSSVYNKRLSTKYDIELLKKYENYLNKGREFENIKLYAYPNSSLSKVDLTILRACNNFEIFLMANDTDLTVLNKDEKLKDIYKAKKVLFNELKKFYYSYHLSKNIKFGYLYLPGVFEMRTKSMKKLPLKIKEEDQSSISEGIYYPTWTLNQFNAVNNKELLFSLILKTVWHNNKYYINKIKPIINNLFGYDDMYIYKEINKLYKRFKPEDTGFDKGEFRYNEIKKAGFLSYIPKRGDIKYLDFGGGIGDITYSIAKNQGYLKSNTFVTDIQNWLGKEHTDEFVKQVTYRYLKTTILPFGDKYFDFITCFQVLHHIADKNFAIKELKRVIKDDGVLLIREHNCETVEDQMLIDIEHSLHAYAVDEQGEDYLQKYNDVYMSKRELRALMESNGFIYVDIKYPEEKGITKYYYSIWKSKS